MTVPLPQKIKLHETDADEIVWLRKHIAYWEQQPLGNHRRDVFIKQTIKEARARLAELNAE